MSSHVYFDFFGTLVDYDPSIHPDRYNAPHEFAGRAGVNSTPDRADALWQQAWSELDNRADRTGRECSLHEIADRYRVLLGSPRVAPSEIDRLIDEYLSAWTADFHLAGGVLECLTDLGRDHRLGIVSNAHHLPLVPGLVDKFGIGDHFSTIVTSIEVGWRKPDRRLFAHLLERDGIAASDAAFVGDNWIADIEGPTRAGMTAFYVGASAGHRVPVALADLPRLIRDQI